MNKNYLTIQKGVPNVYNQYNSKNIKKMNPQKSIEDVNVNKKPMLSKLFQNNSIKRYRTPLQGRHQAESHKNIYQYSENNQYQDNLIDNDASYYKNLYLQTKMNLNKEKQKNEEEQIKNLKTIKENKILENKITNLTTQMDRLIGIVKISKEKNEEELKKKQEELDILTNEINKVNSEKKIINNKYENHIQKLNQISNDEINNLKGQIISLNKNLTLCINEKNQNDRKYKEIINELSQKISENNDENVEKSELINELNEYKNNFNELKLRYSNIELELDTLKNMEQNYNQLLIENNKNLKKLEENSKIINELKSKLNSYIGEVNNISNENEKLKKELISKKNKEQKIEGFNEIKTKYENLLKEFEVKNMKIKI